MYNRLYNFPEKKEAVFLLQFDFRQKYSVITALIYLADKIKYEIDKGIYACRVFLHIRSTYAIEKTRILWRRRNFN